MDEEAWHRKALEQEVAALRRRVAELEILHLGRQLPEDEPRLIAENYRSFVENLTTVFYSHTPDHVLTYMSPQTRGLLGLEPEETLVRWTQLASPNPVNREGLACTQRAIDTGERQPPYELELLHKDGSRVWVEVRETPVVRDGNTVAIVGTLSDITPRKQMARLLHTELALSAALGVARNLPAVLRHVLDAALEIEAVDAGGIYFADEATGALQLIHHEGLSAAFVDRVRCLPADDPRVRRVHATSSSLVTEADDTYASEDMRARASFPVRHDGRLLACLNVASRSVDAFPQPVLDALETIARQVGPMISRVQTEVSLRQSESTLRGVFRAVPAGIGLVSDGVFEWVNEYMARMTGHAEADLVGAGLRVFYDSDEEFDRVWNEVRQRALDTGGGSLETRWCARDGTPLDLYLSYSVLDRTTPLSGIVFAAWDITERKHAEAERRRLEAQVQHTQKLESLGVLAGGIAHDFNNILHVILGNVKLAVDRLPRASQASGPIREIERAVARAAELCAQMLAYAGRGKVDVHPLDLGDLVRDLASMLEVTVSKKANFRVRAQRRLPLVLADAAQLRQVVMNLVTNASEALGDRPGRIDVRIEKVGYDAATLKEEFSEAEVEPGTYVSCMVEDTGCGMDEDARRRVFEPFFTTKFQGRGLGMAAVLGIMRAHGGGIRVESAVGRGSKVTLILPVTAATVRVAPDPGAEGPALRGEGTVLFVDDEAAIRRIGEAVLREAGYDVMLAGDGREAVRVFERHHNRIAAVVLDQTMPEMDGVEAFHAMRDAGAQVPVVLCSGYSEQELRRRFDEDAAPAVFLQKPFGSGDLLRAIAAARKDRSPAPGSVATR